MPILSESDQITFAINDARERGLLLPSFQKNYTQSTIWQFSRRFPNKKYVLRDPLGYLETTFFLKNQQPSLSTLETPWELVQQAELLATLTSEGAKGLAHQGIEFRQTSLLGCATRLSFNPVQCQISALLSFITYRSKQVQVKLWKRTVKLGPAHWLISPRALVFEIPRKSQTFETCDQLFEVSKPLGATSLNIVTSTRLMSVVDVIKAKPM